MTKGTRGIAPRKLIIYYRRWKIDATDRSAAAAKFDGSEQFECPEQPCFEEALRAVKEEINRLEGPEIWIEGYTNEYLAKVIRGVVPRQENENDRPN